MEATSPTRSRANNSVCQALGHGEVLTQKTIAGCQPHGRQKGERNDGQYEGRTRDLGVISTTL
jgi:hypothetical protein